MDIKKTIENLNQNGFKAVCFDTEKDAVDYILDVIPKGSTLGFGGSKTITEIGLAKALFDRGDTLFHRSFRDDLDVNEIYAKALTADWFLSSANAVTEEGEIVNIDGRANRIAGLIFGAQNILIVAGTNKITPDLASAIKRARTVAAPLNMQRFERQAPCREGGDCADCPVETTICNVTSIHHHPTSGKVFHVVLVNSALGF